MEAHTDTTTQAGQILASASGGSRRPGDRIFSNAAVIAAVTVLALLAGVAIMGHARKSTRQKSTS